MNWTRWRRHGFVALMLCWLTGLAWASSAATTTDLIVERQWLEDRSGQLTWEQARQQAMTPFQGVLAQGYGQAPIWVRLRIDPALGATQPGDPNHDTLTLRVRPAYLDEVVVYDPLQQPSQRPSLGDRHPLHTQAEPSTAYLLKLPRGDQPRDLWIRLQTSSTRLAYFEVMENGPLRQAQAVIDDLGMLYLSLIAVFVIWGLTQWAQRPERLLASFVAYEIITLLFGATLLGHTRFYLGHWLPLPLMDVGFAVLGILAAYAYLVFCYFLLREMASSAWLRRSFALPIMLYPCLVVLVLAGHTSVALQINMLAVLLLPIVIVLLAAAIRVAPLAADQSAARLPKSVVVSYFAASFVFALFAASPALGFAEGAQWSLYAILFYSISTGVLMLMMLQYRAWLTIRRQHALTLMAEEALVRASQERSQREDQEKLLAMLGHELKTPLATIRMLLGIREIPAAIAQQINGSIFDITNVVERAIQASQVEASAIHLNISTYNVPQLIESVCQELSEPQRIQVQLLGSGPDTIDADQQLMKIILRNLLDNALKYGALLQPIQLVAQRPGAHGGWEISVRNHAGRAGMPDAQAVFRKFYRSPKASHQSGSGLGLYLVHGLCHLMGGELRYEPDGNLVCFRWTMTTDKAEKKP